MAMAVNFVLQLAALAWFAFSQRRLVVPAMARAASRSLSAAHGWPASAPTPYSTVAWAWTQRAEPVRRQVAHWRFAAAASAMLCVGLAAAVSMAISRAAIAVQIYEVDGLIEAPREPDGSSVAALVSDLAALEPRRLAGRRPWPVPHILPSAFTPPDPITRPPAATLVSNASAQPR